jgi:glycosyltransferase involved in cell wall biosynthesis
MSLAARRAAKEADIVHAHWLPAGAAAAAAGRPFVLTVHGSDVELARRAPRIARTVLRRARVVVSVSRALAEEVRRLGARRIEVIPNGIELVPELGVEADPPHLLYAGRLSPEKGVEELAEAARGLPLVVCGDGPLRSLFPDALGFLPHPELERRYAAAAVVVCPSRREGFGVACAEAMAHGKPVVASRVGGLLDLVVDGETGLLVSPGDAADLRAALEWLLAEPDLRRRLGAAGRAHVAEICSWERVTEATIDVYREAAGGARRRR